jgi:hypothetical protein
MYAIGKFEAKDFCDNRVVGSDPIKSKAYGPVCELAGSAE